MGTIARKYSRPSILTVLRPSRRCVVLARICVHIVAKTRCHVVRMIGKPFRRLEKFFRVGIRNPAVSSTHLLKSITAPLKKIQILQVLNSSKRKGGWFTRRKTRLE